MRGLGLCETWPNATMWISGPGQVANRYYATARSGAVPPRTGRACCTTRSLDHVVGAQQELLGYGEAEHLRGLQVDDHFELRRLHYRQVGGFCAFQDPAAVDAGLAIAVLEHRAIADQPTDLGELAAERHCGQPVRKRQRGEPAAPRAEERIVAGEHRAGLLFGKAGERGFQL